MIEIPGTQLEKAAGEIASDAGKTIVSAVRRRLDAWMAVRAAPDEARAEEIKKAAAHDGEMRRHKEFEESRRLEEKNELIHRIDLAGLARRGMHRIEEQIIDEQKRLEWIASHSIGIAELDPDKNDAREISDDWLKRFFKYAADVDENELLSVLAECLAAAAIRSRPILSPKALDTLRFFDLRSYHMFTFCANTMASFEYLPADMLENEATKAQKELDLPLMMELGLIKEVRWKYANFHIAGMFCTFSYDTGVNYDFRLCQLTHVGRSMLDLLDRRAATLGEALRKHNLAEEHLTLQRELGLNTAVVRSLARLIISQICDTSDCDIIVRSSVNGSDDQTFSARRSLPIDEFPMSPLENFKPSDAYTAELVNSFIEEFKYFNRNQLPYLYTDDEKEKYRRIKNAS